MGAVHSLRVESPYQLLKIEDIKIENKANEHGYLYLKALIDDSINFQPTINASTDDKICVYEELEDENASAGTQENPIDINVADKANSKILFTGIVQNIRTSNINGIYYLEIQALTVSFELDIKEKSRSFQNADMTYDELLGEILKDYSTNNFTQCIGNGEKIGKPLFQYKESDWSFLKRIASELKSELYCDIIDIRNMFYFGRLSNGSHEIEDVTNYKAYKNLNRFHKAGGYEEGYHDIDYFYYEIERREKYQVGDDIWIKDKKLYVNQYSAYAIKDEVIYKYRLCRKNGVWQTKLYNSILGGAALEGKVLAVDGEKVKLHLGIDETQNEDEASWFPYAPPTGNVMYSMPIVGTSARLYFPNEESEGPIVTGCVRSNGSSCAKTSDTTKRYFGTEHGSEIEMTPGAVNIKGGSKEPLSISFDDSIGITLKSPKKLSLNADDEIIIKTPASVRVKAQSQIGVTKTGTENGFSVETDMHFKGSNVIKDGSDRETFAPFDDEPKAGTKPEPPAPPPEEKKPFDWGKLAKNVLAGLAVVALVTVAVVAVAATAGLAAPVLGAIAVGGAIAGTAAVASQAISDVKRGEVSDMSTYMSVGAREAFTGAISGAIFGPFGTVETLGGKMLLGGVTNAFESIVRQKLNGEDINWGTVLFDSSVGVLTAGLFHGGGKLLESGSSFVKNAFSKVISKNESGLLNVAKKIDDLLAPVRVLQTPEGVNLITRESGTKAQDFVSKMAGKAKDNLEKDLLPAERAANKGFSNIETTENGGPDFSKSDYIMKNENGEPIIATIDMSGSRSKDFTRAFDDANIPSSERKKILEDYTWHHVDDYDEATGKCTMQLVQKDAHVATYPHKGSCAQYDNVHGETYNKKYNGKTPKEKAADNGFEINETENGGADFSNTKYLYKTDSGQEATTKIKMSGSKSQDTKALFDNLGISKEEQKELLKENRVFYLDDFDPDTGECTIQIVDQDAYDVVKRYAGAQAQYKANTGIKYR